ncbi:hypothetical protein BGZ59_003665 [Podila verticillata]|nr:hypothetical protein BGZ59_003665 [Podila verticillata]
MTLNYCEGENGVETLSLNLKTKNLAEANWVLDSALGWIDIGIYEHNEKYHIRLKSGDGYSNLARFKQCAVRCNDSKAWIGAFPLVYEFFGDYRVDVAECKDTEIEAGIDHGEENGKSSDVEEEEEEDDEEYLPVIDAHNMPFFQKLIESNLDTSEIVVDGVECAAFRVLVQLLYSGALPPEFEPKVVFADDTTENDETSWENLFLAADHCEVDELREVACTTILTRD